MNAISRSTRGPVTVTRYTAEHAKCSLFVLEVKIISILTYSPTHVLTAIFSGDPGLASTRMSLFWLTGVKDDEAIRCAKLFWDGLDMLNEKMIMTRLNVVSRLMLEVEGIRPRGRLKKTWWDCGKNDMESLGLSQRMCSLGINGEGDLGATG